LNSEDDRGSRSISWNRHAQPPKLVMAFTRRVTYYYASAELENGTNFEKTVGESQASL
jgi:hypothetical protein